MTEPAPRYVPDLALPPYAFVSPHRPHPRRHPAGHSFGRPEPRAEPLDPARPRGSRAYLASIDLFNLGYYWEAHEGWEALWNAAGREGPVAEMLKGLIKLAAAGVKARQGIPDGVRLHGERAEAYFRAVRESTGAASFAGFDLDELAARARDVAARASEIRGDPARAVEAVFAWTLRLST